MIAGLLVGRRLKQLFCRQDDDPEEDDESTQDPDPAPEEDDDEDPVGPLEP